MSKQRIYSRMLISYLIIFLLPLIINLFVLKDIADETQNNICESVRVNLLHTQKSVDDDVREINTIVANLAGNSNIHYIATQMTEVNKNIEYSKIKQAQEYIAALQIQTLMDEYYIYFQKPNMILSPKNVFMNQEASKTFFQYGDIPLEDWLEMMGKSYSRYFFPEALTTQNVKRQEMFLYVQSLRTDTGNKGTFVFPIRSEAVEELMIDYYIPKAGWACVLSEEGNQILAIPSEQGEFQAVDKALLTEQSGILEINNHKRKMQLIYSKSEYTGLIYAAVIPEESITKEISRAQQKLFFITLLVFFVGLCSISIVSWHKGRKITEILQLFFMTAASEDAFLDRADPMEYITQSVSNLIEKNKNLREDMIRQEPLTRSLLLERLMLGRMPGSRMQQSLEKYGIALDGAQLLLVMFSLKEPDGTGSAMEADESAVYMQVLSNELETLFTERKYICNIDVDTSVMILVLEREYEVAKEEHAAKLKDMYKKYREEYGLNLCIGVSAPCKEWKDISAGYDQVCEIMEYRADWGKEILFYDDCKDKNEYYYFPATLEERLINAIKTGNRETTHEQLKQVYTMNVLERDLGPAMMHLLINDLQCTIYKILHSILHTVELNTQELNAQLNYLENEKELLKRFQHINQIFKMLCETVAETNQEDKNQIVEKIASYVEMNYVDQDMSLSKIAEVFGYARTYFSRLFKELFDMNFTTYLEQVRIEHVCLLLQEDITLEKIAGMTGYNSVHVLRTAFKRIKGIAPNEYRKNIVKNDED